MDNDSEEVEKERAGKDLINGFVGNCMEYRVFKLDENVFPTKTIFLSKDLFDAMKDADFNGLCQMKVKHITKARSGTFGICPNNECKVMVYPQEKNCKMCGVGLIWE